MQVTQFTDQRISRTWETPNPLAIIRAHVGDYEDTLNHNKASDLPTLLRTRQLSKELNMPF